MGCVVVRVELYQMSLAFSNDESIAKYQQVPICDRFGRKCRNNRAHSHLMQNKMVFLTFCGSSCVVYFNFPRVSIAPNATPAHHTNPILLPCPSNNLSLSPFSFDIFFTAYPYAFQ